MIDQATAPPRNLSLQEFAALGLGSVAYIRQEKVAGQPVFKIHTADGREVAEAADWDTAVTTVRLNDLEPVAVQ